MVRRLFAGGSRIRTIGPAEKETAVERGPAADQRRLARRPVLNDPIQLIGPASLVGNSRETFHKSGTDRRYGRAARNGNFVAAFSRWSAAMPQPNDLSRSLVALDQNSTIIAVIELSQSSWLVVGMLPGIERQPHKSWSQARNGCLPCCIAGGMRRSGWAHYHAV